MTDLDDPFRTPYTYAEPKDAAEALARIEHWMGDTGAFQARLGLHDPGFDQEPYHPRFSGTHTENSKWDAMLAADMARYPERWVDEVVPLPPLRDDWIGTLIRTQVAVQRFWSAWISTEVLKKYARELVKKGWAKLGQQQTKLLVKLGEPASVSKVPTKQQQKTAVWPSAIDQQPLVNPNMTKLLDRTIAEEKVERDRKPKPNDPRDDGTLFS